MKSHRYLLVDLLEDRRLLAGLDVRVFDDPFSTRLPDVSSVPVAERVVYLDINSDGVQQSAEPIGISDIDGIARFRNLDPGTYLVRLLGSTKSQVQTTDTQPAATGTWTGKIGALQTLIWQSDSVGWFATDDSLIEFDLERGSILTAIPMSGRVLSAAMQNETQGVALVESARSQTELVAFDLKLASTRRLSNPSDLVQGTAFESQGNKQLISMGSTTLLRRSASDGDVLLRIPSLDDWDSNPELVPIASGIASDAVIDSFGDRALILSQGVLDGSRITLLRYEDNSLEIEAQRDFESSVRVSSLSPVTRKLAIESTRGIEILSASTGLPTFLVLEQAVGPSVFDTSRGIFWSLSKSNTSRLVGWGIADGVKVFDVLFAQAGTSMLAVRTEFSLGFRSDMLIGIRDGQIYRHSLSTAQGTVAQLADQVIQQVAIGVRSRGQSNPPILRSLPSMQAIEDTPAVIQTSDWVQATSDADGDSVHYIIVNAGEQGTVSWSTSSGGVYSPKPNANGQDRVVVQAYDGRGWSTPQTVSIQIQPVNDAPQGLLYSGVLAIPENQPGYVLGSLSIVDPDANEVFDYSVSDGRFEVVGNTLKVRDTAMIPYQNPGWIDLVLSARSRTNGDRIDRSERIFIVQDPTPFHNDINPGDVDGDGRITPLDPLIIINYINSNGSGQISPPGEGEAHNDLDVDGDGQVSPLDILLVINALNQANSEAEGEGAEAGGTSDPSTPQRAPIELDDPLGLKKPKR